LAVVTGEGLKQLYAGLGVAVLDGGPTLNPSTYDLLAAIHAIPAEEIVVLPNSSNVFMAAERAAELSDKRVEVVHSRSLQAGLAAAVAFLPNSGATDNAALMAEIVEQLHTGAVARAARDDPQGRFHTGDAVGFVDDELVHWGDPEQTLGAVIAALATEAELVTCIRGLDAPLSDDVVRALAAPEVELELSDGGQESYWWLLSAE
jgi:dihydroxyacetone kinase-like predicted kinase